MFGGQHSDNDAKPMKLRDISAIDEPRIDMRDEELNRVLGGVYWRQRNLDLSYILLDWQYRAFCDATYFYRPLYWDGGFWHFGIYARFRDELEPAPPFSTGLLARR